MPGVIEDMPFEARMQRMREIAEELVALLRQMGSMDVMEALRKAAGHLRVAISQVKYGLSYALSNSMVTLSKDETQLSVAA